MKIVLNHFKGNKDLVLEEELHPDDLELDIGVMHFPRPLMLHAQAWKSDDELTVQAHVEGERSFTCSLCLEEFNNLFEKDITLHYDIKGLDSVTIDSDVRDEVLLEHPIRILCRPDCRGLCLSCGTNLNLESCDCQGPE
ncbi:MAG: DUF177 domain-containing protein [Candidatus Omnitrophica bacterium]|nr:DUF177 domain-containing protein [Candidatus Omnitrophota bacterium]